MTFPAGTGASRGVASSPAGASSTSAASPRAAAPRTASPSTTTSPYVTLQPTGSSGSIPGDANDPADFYGLGAAIVGIVVAIVVTRVVFRGRGTRR